MKMYFLLNIGGFSNVMLVFRVVIILKNHAWRQSRESQTRDWKTRDSLRLLKYGVLGRAWGKQGKIMAIQPTPPNVPPPETRA